MKTVWNIMLISTVPVDLASLEPGVTDIIIILHSFQILKLIVRLFRANIRMLKYQMWKQNILHDGFRKQSQYDISENTNH